MNKLSKEKKDKLILTCIACVGVIAVLYFLVITDQKREIEQLNGKIAQLKSKRDIAAKQVKRLPEMQAEVEKQKAILVQKQLDMQKPEADHVWFLHIMEKMREQYGLGLDEIKPPSPIDPGVLPKFPFRAVELRVSMLGDYTVFGRFLADFENRYPYLRVEIMSISPERGGAGTRTAEALSNPSAPKEPTQLRFNYRVIALVKTPV
jgi:Tfp pilus assembly protein PilO